MKLVYRNQCKTRDWELSISNPFEIKQSAEFSGFLNKQKVNKTILKCAYYK